MEKKGVIKSLFICIIVAMLSACSTFQSDDLRLPLTYATLKVIERDNDIDRDDVLNAMDKLESLVTSDVSFSKDLRQDVIDTLNIQSLSPADQFLVLEVLDRVEDHIRLEIELGSLPEDVKVNVQNMIEVVRQAALMY